MSGDRDLSRRQVLAGVAGASSIGALAGGITGAVLGDSERFFDNQFVAGAFELDMHWTGGPSSGNQFALTIEDLNPGETGHADLSLELPADDQDNNPGLLWLRATCPAPPTLLGEFLEVTLSYADCDSGEAVETIRGPLSLRKFADQIRNGIQLRPPPELSGTNGECLPVGQEICLRLDYALSDGYLGEESLAMSFQVVAEQCRHNEAANPFPTVAECEKPECVCCERVGKLELDEESQSGIGDSSIEEGIYTFTEVCNGLPGYQLEVLDTVDKSDGETVAAQIRVLDSGGMPVPLCEAIYKGATTSRTVTFEPFAFGTGLVAAPAREDDAGPVESDPDAYYGISHITASICTNRAPADCDAGGCEEA